MRKHKRAMSSVELLVSEDRDLTNVTAFTTIFDCVLPKRSAWGPRVIQMQQFEEQFHKHNTAPNTVTESNPFSIKLARGVAGKINPAGWVSAAGATARVQCTMVVDTDFVLSDDASINTFEWERNGWEEYDTQIQREKVLLMKSKGTLNTIGSTVKGWAKFVTH
jgi:hypothetical protein